MIIATCGACNSEVKKGKNDPPGCPICGLGWQTEGFKFVPYPVPYPYTPWWSPDYLYKVTSTKDNTSDNTFGWSDNKITTFSPSSNRNTPYEIEIT